ncbi:uncharacterized protein LOC132311431 [Cornus florida]|uniref:uncharacterized protein LOC132311431 n=1 Tax=Cornus florida TaxID=4283 RepID=UPI00289BD115|nr:uncharacterized protein LOC132311431 [Cornus florida]
MMKFVRTFHSMDLRRNFLKSLDCLDELFLLEEESGNFLEAAEIAKLRGDLLLEAELLGKAGHYCDASLLILWYVFSNSLWISGSKGWPLKQFAQKKELLANAKLLAKKESYAFSESYVFYESVCTEVNILSNEQSKLFELNNYFNASQRQKSLRGEILSIRKILDAHFHFNTLKYAWEDELIVDLTNHSEEKISQNLVSVETLVYFWNMWKEYVVNIFEYLGCLETQNVSKYQGFGEFCLNYFGVRKQFNNLNITYVLMNSDADWVRELDDRFLRSSGKLVSVDVHQFVSAARTHWHAELLAVGMKVLVKLEALYKFTARNSSSVFCQSICLIHIFEVTKFLLESKFHDLKHHDTRKLQTFFELSTEYFQKVFPFDWRESLAENMISLRGTELSRKLLEEVICRNLKGKLTYGQIGRVVMVWLGSKTPADELCEEFVKRFDVDSSWRVFVENLRGKEDIESSPSSSSIEAVGVSLVHEFLKAMEDTFNVNWRNEIDYISPSCFLYLVEHLLISASYVQEEGYFLTTKSSFIEWLFHLQPNTNPSANLVTDVQMPKYVIFGFVSRSLQQFVYNKKETADRIKNSNINFNYYYPLLVLRLFVLLCLLCAGTGYYFDVLFTLLWWNDITSKLPREFFTALRNDRKIYDFSVFEGVKVSVAEAFKKIGDPLVVVSLGGDCSELLFPDAIFVDMRDMQCKEDIMRVLFPTNTKAYQGKKVAVEETSRNSWGEKNSLNCDDQGKCYIVQSCSFASMEDRSTNTKNGKEGNLQTDWGLLWEISDILKPLDDKREGILMKCS